MGNISVRVDVGRVAVAVVLSAARQSLGGEHSAVLGAALILQSVWFSFLHYQSGFPSGVVGILLTFVFGMMMGYLVKRTGGVLLAVLIHAVADFTIFVLIVLRMNGLF